MAMNLLQYYDDTDHVEGDEVDSGRLVSHQHKPLWQQW